MLPTISNLPATFWLTLQHGLDDATPWLHVLAACLAIVSDIAKPRLKMLTTLFATGGSVVSAAMFFGIALYGLNWYPQAPAVFTFAFILAVLSLVLLFFQRGHEDGALAAGMAAVLASLKRIEEQGKHIDDRLKHLEERSDAEQAMLREMMLQLTTLGKGMQVPSSAACPPSRPRSRRKTPIFMNYAHADRDIAARVRVALTAAGYDVFDPVVSISPGQRWTDTITSAIHDIAERGFFLALLSQAYFTSAWAERERSQQSFQGSGMVPVVVADRETVLERKIRPAVDLSSGDFDKRMQELISYLNDHQVKPLADQS
jgi:hypothetical protein